MGMRTTSLVLVGLTTLRTLSSMSATASPLTDCQAALANLANELLDPNPNQEAAQANFEDVLAALDYAMQKCAGTGGPLDPSANFDQQCVGKEAIPELAFQVCAWVSVDTMSTGHEVCESVYPAYDRTVERCFLANAWGGGSSTPNWNGLATVENHGSGTCTWDGHDKIGCDVHVDGVPMGVPDTVPAGSRCHTSQATATAWLTVGNVDPIPGGTATAAAFATC